MKTTFDKKRSSAAKRIIPAAAMLALSTVMLSTSTYAWFTMNKEVQMTGLNMTATSGEGMEISLAAVDESNHITFDGDAFENGHPKDAYTETGWKSAVIVGNYYKDIGKLKPASSVDGEHLFDATDASNSGKTASKFKALTLGEFKAEGGGGDMAQIQTQTEFLDSNTTVASDGTIGYYVDIPVHLRTSKVKPSESDTKGDIYCKMIIKNNGANDDKLYKAVRVAFIPTTGDTGSTTKIFTVDELNAYYTKDGDVGKAVNSATNKAAVQNLTKDYVVDTADFQTGEGADSGLKIPYAASSGTYGHLDFTVRVWLEGESTSCYDQTAGQSWNIDLAFSLGEFSTP